MADSDQKENEEKVLPKIFLYVSDFEAKHPLNPEVKQIRARAINEEGHEEAEFFGRSIGVIQAQATQFSYGRTIRLVFVENPAAHPQLSRLLDAAEDVVEASREGMVPASKPRYEKADLILMRSQHHLCTACTNAEICAIATHPMFGSQIITISGCMGYRPDEREPDERVHKPLETT